MKRRPLLIVAAVLLALLGTVAVYAYAHSADKRAVNGLKATTVLLVTKTIPAGTPWSAIASGGYTTTESVPTSAAPATALTESSPAVPSDQVATFAVTTGQILVREMFAAPVATTGALAIPGKLQALSISLSSNADVSGFPQAGSQVAVYSTHQLQHAPGGAAQQIGGSPYATKLLIPRVAVLAVSQAAPSNVNGSGTGASGSLLVTLAVTQQQAERIILAQKVGDLYLALLTDSSASSEDGGVIGVGLFNPAPLFSR